MVGRDFYGQTSATYPAARFSSNGSTFGANTSDYNFAVVYSGSTGSTGAAGSLINLSGTADFNAARGANLRVWIDPGSSGIYPKLQSKSVMSSSANSIFCDSYGWRSSTYRAKAIRILANGQNIGALSWELWGVE